MSSDVRFLSNLLYVYSTIAPRSRKVRAQIKPVTDIWQLYRNSVLLQEISEINRGRNLLYVGGKFDKILRPSV